MLDLPAYFLYPSELAYHNMLYTALITQMHFWPPQPFCRTYIFISVFHIDKPYFTPKLP